MLNHGPNTCLWAEMVNPIHDVWLESYNPVHDLWLESCTLSSHVYVLAVNSCSVDCRICLACRVSCARYTTLSLYNLVTESSAFHLPSIFCLMYSFNLHEDPPSILHIKLATKGFPCNRPSQKRSSSLPVFPSDFVITRYVYFPCEVLLFN